MLRGRDEPRCFLQYIHFSFTLFATTNKWSFPAHSSSPFTLESLDALMAQLTEFRAECRRTSPCVVRNGVRIYLLKLLVFIVRPESQRWACNINIWRNSYTPVWTEPPSTLKAAPLVPPLEYGIKGSGETNSNQFTVSVAASILKASSADAAMYGPPADSHVRRKAVRMAGVLSCSASTKVTSMPL